MPRPSLPQAVHREPVLLPTTRSVLSLVMPLRHRLLVAQATFTLLRCVVRLLHATIAWLRLRNSCRSRQSTRRIILFYSGLSQSKWVRQSHALFGDSALRQAVLLSLPWQHCTRVSSQSFDAEWPNLFRVPRETPWFGWCRWWPTRSEVPFLPSSVLLNAQSLPEPMCTSLGLLTLVNLLSGSVSFVVQGLRLNAVERECVQPLSVERAKPGWRTTPASELVRYLSRRPMPMSVERAMVRWVRPLQASLRFARKALSSRSALAVSPSESQCVPFLVPRHFVLFLPCLPLYITPSFVTESAAILLLFLLLFFLWNFLFGKLPLFMPPWSLSRANRTLLVKWSVPVPSAQWLCALLFVLRSVSYLLSTLCRMSRLSMALLLLLLTLATSAQLSPWLHDPTPSITPDGRPPTVTPALLLKNLPFLITTWSIVPLPTATPLLLLILVLGSWCISLLSVEFLGSWNVLVPQMNALLRILTRVTPVAILVLCTMAVLLVRHSSLSCILFFFIVVGMVMSSALQFTHDRWSRHPLGPGVMSANVFLLLVVVLVISESLSVSSSVVVVLGRALFATSLVILLSSAASRVMV